MVTRVSPALQNSVQVDTTLPQEVSLSSTVFDIDVTGSVRIWDAVGPDMALKTETKVISGRINDLAWDGESQRIIAVGDGKERYGHAFTYDSGNTVGEVRIHTNIL
jgi:hypothetical protein